MLNEARRLIYCFFADGVIKSYKMSFTTVRDEVKMRNRYADVC